MHKQKGVTFVGMVVVAILVVLVAVLGLRLLPAYMEYYTVKNTMKQINRTFRYTYLCIYAFMGNIYSAKNIQSVELYI